MAAIARTIASIIVGVTSPSLRMKRCRSMSRNCKVSTAETLVRPLVVSGSIRTCQMLGAKYSLQSVSGATNLMGRRPTASELTTTAGRVFWISVPTVGSKLTSQMSPRRGGAGLGLDNVASLPHLTLTPLWFLLVVFCHALRLRSKAFAALFERQLHIRATLCEGAYLLGLCHWCLPTHSATSCGRKSTASASHIPGAPGILMLESTEGAGLCHRVARRCRH